MTYENEICPVCGKAFNENDDVVVCPICGTPHHRQCYLDNKNCKNASLHSESFEWQPSAKDEVKSVEVPVEAPVDTLGAQQTDNAGKADDGHKIVFCPKCGKENPAEEPTCRYCGERLYNNGEKGVFSQSVMLPDMSAQQFGTPIIRISPDDTIDGNKVSDVAEYIQLNANKYIPKMYKMEKTGKKTSFNWAAFLFTPYWFFFRRMHTIGFLLMVVLLAVTGACSTQRMNTAAQQYDTVVENYYNGTASYEEVMNANKTILTMPETIISFAVELGVKLFGGFFGTYFYKKKVKSDIDDSKKTATSPEEYRLLIFKKGGISGWMCALAVIGYYCAAQIVAMMINNAG